MEWQWQRRNNMVFLTIPAWFKLGVQVVFTSRMGGVSKEPYSSLNLALHVDDRPEDVIINRSLFLNELAYSMNECVAAEQVHGNRVMLVTAKDRGRGMKERQTALPACDGLITSENIGLMSFYADCVPLYFFNPARGLVGLAHAGWKGTIQNIAAEVLAQMELLGAAPEACLAGIGPCVGACCYEVGENVAAAFREKFNNPSVLKETSSGKYKLDLVKANEEHFLSGGILRKNIAIAHCCTSCNPMEFYSYRREGNTGRMAAFIRKMEGV